MSKSKKPKPPSPLVAPFLDGDFDPKPTVFKGGIDRMIQVFNALRDQNQGGYGGGVVNQVGTGSDKWSIHPDSNKWTSCSPFTATVLGILFDPAGATSGDCQPMYDDGTKPLPHAFYSMHQGNYLKFLKSNYPALFKKFRKNGWDYCNHSTGSAEFFNLGYPIKPKDLRRGDLIGIDWSNRGGHAAFVWDVHLDEDGEVDCFCYLSANGGHTSPKVKKKFKDEGKKPPPYWGTGISIGGGTMFKPYIGGSFGSFKALMSPLFQDRPEHIRDAGWHMIPGKLARDLDRSTFKKPGLPKHANPPDKSSSHLHVASMKCIRLWGIAPPDRPAERGEAGNFDLAKQLAYMDPPPSYATGQGEAEEVHVPKAPVTVQKGDVEKVKKAAPKPAKQHAERPTGNQQFVEDALQKLFRAGWIDKDPGDPGKINDAQTKDAVKDFQAKFDAPPVDGDPGPITRKALRKALADLAAGRPGPRIPRRSPRWTAPPGCTTASRSAAGSTSRSTATTSIRSTSSPSRSRTARAGTTRRSTGGCRSSTASATSRSTSPRRSRSGPRWWRPSTVPARTGPSSTSSTRSRSTSGCSASPGRRPTGRGTRPGGPSRCATSSPTSGRPSRHQGRSIGTRSHSME